MLRNVRIRRNDLPLRVQVLPLLELKVSQRSRESKVTVNTAKLDKPATGDDAGLLAWVGGLVVEGERLGFAANGHDGAGVTGVGL